jgi:hypothetical protein
MLDLALDGPQRVRGRGFQAKELVPQLCVDDFCVWVEKGAMLLLYVPTPHPFYDSDSAFRNNAA